MPRPGAGAETPRSKPQSPLRITHDGQFYARLLSKEISSSLGGNPSFRYYGAGPGAVPFVWESHPGTPKDAAAHSSSSAAAAAVVITPPPSYHLRAAAAGQSHGFSRRRSSNGKGGGRANKYCGGYRKLNRWIKIGFIATVFRRLAFGKPTKPTSSSPASVKSSSTRWLFSASSGAAADGRDVQEYYYDPPPPTTTKTTTKGMRLCLGVRPSPASSWMVQFWGGGGRVPDGWVYGWRP